MHCPKCNSKNVVKNGCTHYGKQRLKCQNCGRQFVENPTRQPINHSTRELIDKLLLERVSLAAMPSATPRANARVTGVSLRWLQYYVFQKYYQVSKSVEVTKKKPGRLVIQIDEMWSYVGSKANKQWIWQAIDSETREIVGVYVGDRSAQAAKQLWRSLPPVYRGAGDTPPPVNVQFVTQIFGRLTNKYYLVNGIVQSVRIVVRQAILND